MQTISDILPYRKVYTSRIWTLPYYLTPKGTPRQRTQLLVWKWKRKMRTDWALKRKKKQIQKQNRERKGDSETTGKQTTTTTNKPLCLNSLRHWDYPLAENFARTWSRDTRAIFQIFMARTTLLTRTSFFFVFFARVCSFLFTLCCFPFSRLFIGIKFGVWAYHSRRTFS